MKLEIDFSKPEELRKQEQELEMALSTIRSALQAINKNGSVLPAILIPPAAESSKQTPKGIFAEPIASLPDEFTMRQAMEHAKKMEFSLGSTRRVILAHVKDGEIKIAQQGQGRRPSIFRKA